MVREMEDPDEAATKSLRLTSGPKYLSQFSSSTYMGLSVVFFYFQDERVIFSQMERTEKHATIAVATAQERP